MRTALIVACALLVFAATVPGAATADHVPCIEERGKGHWPGPDSHGRFNPNECPGLVIQDPCISVDPTAIC